MKTPISSIICDVVFLHSAFCILHSAFPDETLATFGTARLVKYLSGKIELVGGSPADRLAAKEWCSLFMHEAVFACSPPGSHIAAPRHLQPQQP
jgi:hypothetical protein